MRQQHDVSMISACGSGLLCPVGHCWAALGFCDSMSLYRTEGAQEAPAANGPAPSTQHTQLRKAEEAAAEQRARPRPKYLLHPEEKRKPRWSRLPPARVTSTGRWLAAGPSRSTSSPRPLPPSALPAPGLAPTGPALLPSGAAPPRATRRSRRRTPFSRPSLVRNLPCFFFFFFFLPHCPRIIRSTSY